MSETESRFSSIFREYNYKIPKKWHLRKLSYACICAYFVKWLLYSALRKLKFSQIKIFTFLLLSIIVPKECWTCVAPAGEWVRLKTQAMVSNSSVFKKCFWNHLLLVKARSSISNLLRIIHITYQPWHCGSSLDAIW